MKPTRSTDSRSVETSAPPPFPPAGQQGALAGGPDAGRLAREDPRDPEEREDRQGERDHDRDDEGQHLLSGGALDDGAQGEGGVQEGNAGREGFEADPRHGGTHRG